MSKEEIEAIEYLKSKLKDTLPLYEDIEVDGKVFRMNVLQLETKWNNETAIKVETVLDLLNKQQNEIERLKEQLNQYYDGKLFTANQLKAIEREQNKYYIHKDKIREKIKELENQKVSIKVGFEKIFETKMNNAKIIDTLRELLRGE